MASNTKGRGRAYLWLMEHRSDKSDDCLTWPFSFCRGYGHFGHLGEMLYAHRFMCELVHGPSPSPRHYAAHSCGNGDKGCVNPLHLSWRTPSQNQLDRTTHGRPSRGGRPQFTPRQILEIRRLKGRATQDDIAALLGVPRSTIAYWQRTTHEPTRKARTVRSFG